MFLSFHQQFVFNRSIISLFESEKKGLSKVGLRPLWKTSVPNGIWGVRRLRPKIVSKIPDQPKLPETPPFTPTSPRLITPWEDEVCVSLRPTSLWFNQVNDPDFSLTFLYRPSPLVEVSSGPHTYTDTTIIRPHSRYVSTLSLRTRSRYVLGFVLSFWTSLTSWLENPFLPDPIF